MSSSTISFESLKLSPPLLQALAAKGYQQPTPIQAQAIPPALSGRDVIGCAATGTGKTAAFTLPVVERMRGKRGIVALVLAPTRELALQIAEHAEYFGAPHGVKVATLIGGVGMGGQRDALRRANFCIATPGRLIDHLSEGSATLAHVEVLVLDEADRMLDMGFKAQLDKILSKLPKARQTLLFSATMAGEVASFAKVHTRDAVRVEVSRSGTTAKNATQCVYEVGQNEKQALMLTLLADDDLSTLIFTRTKRRADALAKAIAKGGYAVERIHANRSQSQRVQALEGFRSGKYRVLVATDIAARGIDVAEIGHVVNFDLPHVPADYVHRVGRTARVQASGHASAFCSPEERPLLDGIEKLVRAPIPRRPVPRDAPVFQKVAAAQHAAKSHAPPSANRPQRSQRQQRRSSRVADAPHRSTGKVLFRGGPKRGG